MTDLTIPPAFPRDSAYLKFLRAYRAELRRIPEREYAAIRARVMEAVRKANDITIHEEC